MRQLEVISDTVQHLYVSLLLQGVVFLTLAILILIYPEILFALVAATFVLVGASLLVVSWKVYALWKKLPDFIKK